jgi:hypothetical protein
LPKSLNCLVFIFVLFFLFPFELGAQKRVLRTRLLDTVQFTLSPYSKIAFEGLFNKKKHLHFKKNSKYRYQYIIVKGLPGTNYYRAVDAIHRATHLFARDKQTILLMENYHITGPGEQTPGHHAEVQFSGDSTTVSIEIDMDALLNGDVLTNYHRMFAELLPVLYGPEKKQKWPISTSQSLLEEVLQRIPFPSKTSLLRYFAFRDENKSYVMLNTQMLLAIDTVKHVTNPQFIKEVHLLGNQTLIQLRRDESGNLMQHPFFRFQGSGLNLPDNILVPEKKVLQASSVDLQLSSTLNTCRFVFLQQQSFKPNNTNSQSGICAGLENDPFDKCNSVLFHFDTLTRFYDATNDLIDESSAQYLSSFGVRNFINPMIQIIIDGRREPVMLGTTLESLKKDYPLPASFKIYHLWRDKYVPVLIGKDSTYILLPGDTIKY